MPLRVEDYALIGGSETAALVGRDGSIDWLCWPRFGSGTCFAALLGTPEHRRWRIAPADPTPQVTRRYQDGTLVLETVFQVPVGELAFTDLMPPRDAVPRLVTGRRGQVAMELDLTIRFDYGRSMPWVTRLSDGHGIRAIAGPDMATLHSPVPLHGQDIRLLRAAMGSLSQIQIMYGLGGERRLPEFEAGWLAGYQGARLVHIGNRAHEQLQLEVFGEQMDAFHQTHCRGPPMSGGAWALPRALVGHLKTVWLEPDEGIREARDGRRCFSYSKAMAWAALDRTMHGIEMFGMQGPLACWRALRQEIRDEVLVRRHRPAEVQDGLPGGVGVFFPCRFWFADVYALTSRGPKARVLFERLLGLRKDVGLLSEEHDPRICRMLGNFPQAFSHVE